MQIIEKENDLWFIRTPAKLNLFFEVHGKRSDGFHEITSLACPVEGLYDELAFIPRDDDVVKFDCFLNVGEGEGTDVPSDENNIVVKALKRLKAETGSKQGAVVSLCKMIPSQAGLGGGSSDAAAILLLANRVWKLGLSPDDLSRIAAMIGSDCPIFLQNGASVSRGRGEIIEPFVLPTLHFVLLKPKEGLSTAAVYAACMKCHDGIIRRLEDVVAPLKQGDIPEFGRRLFNRLEKPAAAIWPGFEATKKKFEPLDCLAVQMSGSGTAFFGLCRDLRHADEAAEWLENDGNASVFSVRS